MLHGRDGAEDGEAVDAGLDVGRGAVLVGQHLGDAGDLVARRDDQRDHGRAIAAGLLQALDQLLHLPDLHVLVRRRVLAGGRHDGELLGELLGRGFAFGGQAFGGEDSLGEKDSFASCSMRQRGEGGRKRERTEGHHITVFGEEILRKEVKIHDESLYQDSF